MRIVHTDTDDIDNPLRGGQPVRTFEVNSRLSDRHDITILTATYANSIARVQRDKLAYRRLGFNSPRFGLSSHLSFLGGLRQAIKHTPHDLIVEEFTPPIGFCFTPWFTSRPVISIVQWFFFDEWTKRYGLPFEAMMKKIGKRGRYQNFIVQTEKMRRYFAQLVPEANIWTLGCGINDDVFSSWDSSADDNYVLFIGRLSVEQKGLDLLIDAWSELRRQGFEIPLRIVGEGPARPWLENEIVARGLGDCITLLGRHEGPSKLRLLHSCTFVVMPSREETFGIVALEAMAAAKAVVAFDINHLNELLRPEWAIIAGAPDAVGLANALIRAWQYPDHRMMLGNAAYKVAQVYRWDEVARQQEQIYLAVTATAD